MVDSNNKYTHMQRQYYDSTHELMSISNHSGHNSNPDYYGLLLKDITENPTRWTNKIALEFGCGCGRNVRNLLTSAPFERVDGCDISGENIKESEKYLQSENISKDKYNLYTTDGVSLQPIEDHQYDFIMSTIVLQHIAVHDIRYNLLKDIYRTMKENGIFSFQMVNIGAPAKYFDNTWNASGTNGAFDVAVSDPNDLIKELTEIGFKNITYTIRPEWDANTQRYFPEGHPTTWIYVRTIK